MALAQYLADTSAVARRHHEPVANRLDPLIDHGLVATCGIVELETRFSARNGEEYAEVAMVRDLSYEWLSTEDDDLKRALQVQRELAATGKLRAVKFADLLVAAVAERHRVSILHYDSDFDTIAKVTGQATEWVVERGSVP